ncbi:MAG TPA: hypothetical protein VJ783_24650, partial [Pirellulales bacterium]|nr:hypothetical protein [Pirellulales bacterium]
MFATSFSWWSQSRFPLFFVCRASAAGGGGSTTKKGFVLWLAAHQLKLVAKKRSRQPSSISFAATKNVTISAENPPSQIFDKLRGVEHFSSSHSGRET